MKVTARLNNIRIAPRKTKLVADLIRGLDIPEAVNQLDTTVKKTSPAMKKLLLSAVANAENNFGLDKDNLYVYEVIVGAGPTLKRWMPKAFGRAGEILKRTSKIKLVLEERVEGKGRKTKEQMEKEKKARMEERRKKEKEMAKEDAEEKKELPKNMAEKDKDMEKGKKEAVKKGWTNKIFRRKSM